MDESSLKNNPLLWHSIERLPYLPSKQSPTASGYQTLLSAITQYAIVTMTVKSLGSLGLLDMPAELRLQVYDLVYQPCFQPQQQFNPFFCAADLKYCPKKGRSTLLHQVNRQLRSECLPFYLERTTFVFDLSVLDPDTAEPTLVSWAKATQQDAKLECNIIINMRVVPKARPMFTIFVSNTKSGQRLSFKENDFRAECYILARGMRDAKELRAQSVINCFHVRCSRYVGAINDLKQTLRWLTLEIPSLRKSLSVNDVSEIAKASKLLRLLRIPPRWSRFTSDELTAAQEAFISRSENLKVLEKKSEEVGEHREEPRKVFGWIRKL